jgi:NAD-dependent dihydropyrimidine dehydrogenase PreA subunit
MAMFIRIDANNDVIKKTEGVAKKLVEVCPVKIFKAGAQAGTVDIVEDNVDECTLCDLCMKASPDGVKVVKLYDK